MSDELEILVVAIIVLGLGLAIWRGGGANPEGTGKLGRRVGSLEKTLNSSFADMEKEMISMDQRLKQFEQFSVQLSDLKEDGVKTAQSVRHIAKQVDLIMSVIVPKGMGK